MTIIAAYQDAGSYRGAAAICGTTHKTVKRVIKAGRRSILLRSRPGAPTQAAPVQPRYAELAADPGSVDKLLAAGRDRAIAFAKPQLDAATRAIGLMS